MDKDAALEQHAGWREYHDCMILSHHWDEILPLDGCGDLCDELRPAISATISLEGGIRIPRQNAWSRASNRS